MARLFPRLRAEEPAPDFVRAGLQKPSLTRLRLDRFPRGIDNLHIDVVLGPFLGRAAASYVSALVREEVQRLWKQETSAFSGPAAHGFAEVVQEHHSAAVSEARSLNRLERIQLFQLAVMKLLLGQVDAELAALRGELEDARSQPARQLSGQSLQLHQQAVTLGVNLEHVRYRVAAQLVREFIKLENRSMKSLRKSILGLAWPVPEVMLANPLLQLDGLGTPRDFCRVYPLVLHDDDAAHRANRCVLGTLTDWLPDIVDIVHPSAQAGQQSATPRSDKGTARGFHETERRMRSLVGKAEIDDCSGHWIDLPDNATALLGGSEADWPVPGRWSHTGIGALQRRLNEQLGTRLVKERLLRPVLASYELAAIFPALGLKGAETLMFDFLKGSIGRREMLRRLEALDGVSDPVAMLRRTLELRRDYRRSPGGGRRQLVARFAGDLLRLRRDLKLGWRAFVGMDCIRLISNEQDVALSQANNLLQLFCRQETAVTARGDVVGHVVIRADIRGVTDLAAQMRRRNLSASAHFSRFFFDPVNRLIERFDAQKVVVQGDAILLSILEHGGVGMDRLAVARACCLAAEILGQVKTMNAENERQGLPLVELGLGIAYADEAPTFLYDQVHKVTVSPAIELVRRLSSCHIPLRETCNLPGGQGVCVAAPVYGTDRDDPANEALVRYNVNGIELDAAAFAQLNVEIPLRRLRARDKSGRGSAVLHAGVCTDIEGQSHWLVVREEAVKLWMGRQLLDTDNESRLYYEVVSDKRLIARIQARIGDA